MSQPNSSGVTYEGVLQGLEKTEFWQFEGTDYSTPATESDVLETVAEALSEPDKAEVVAARDFVFGPRTGFAYTSQALLAMLVAYERECEGGEGVEAVASILREAARRIAIVEALTV